MKHETSRSSSYVVECEDYVHVVEFYPYESGSAESLIAYGGNNYVVVGSCRFQVSISQISEVVKMACETKEGPFFLRLKICIKCLC